ncbi:hypothetical protein M378DRAFT_625112 [Amanita muscaria Koide BX008]|uniref:Uncharacterized protein n=1 Tax=Amanita muscaria (strain Koide BX008) TaxID=946122 RepID=A0A0C2X813_AMAMK|nr:hypothetical protein M378DRAFT_625112 [Amanita muscaria Koide BX008]
MKIPKPMHPSSQPDSSVLSLRIVGPAYTGRWQGPLIFSLSSNLLESDIYSNISLSMASGALAICSTWRSTIDNKCFLGIGSLATIVYSITVVLSHQPSSLHSSRMQKVYAHKTHTRTCRDRRSTSSR